MRLIDRINFDDGFVHCEMGTVSGCEQKHSHHHPICMKCGKVTSARDDLLEELEEKLTATTGFSIPAGNEENSREVFDCESRGETLRCL